MAERFGRQQVQFTLFIDPPRVQRGLPRPTSNEPKGQFDGQETLDLRGQEAA